jgi:hypothetical protein
VTESYHVIKVRYFANCTAGTAVCAYCNCGWASATYHLTGTEIEGRDVAAVAAEVEGTRHVEQACSMRI